MNDIDSGGFEVDDDTLVASDRLLARYPNAQTWFVRIGHAVSIALVVQII